MALNQLRIISDQGRGDIEAIPMPTHVDARVLTVASTNEDHTVPATAKYVIFSSTADFFAKPGGSAAVPAADVTDGSGSELNPTVRDVRGVSTIGLISTVAGCVITLAFYE